jgi:hypothetical protein
MKPGDSVKLKNDYNVSMSFGNVGLMIAGGSDAIVLRTEGYTDTVMVGFKLTETITATVLVDKEALE